jgi:hypothetical protein
LKRYLPENLVKRPKKGFGFSLNQIGKETLINDFLKAAKFHRDNSQNLGVDKNLYEFIDGNEYLIFNKFPRFAFALIMNMKIIENV